MRLRPELPATWVGDRGRLWLGACREPVGEGLLSHTDWPPMRVRTGPVPARQYAARVLSVMPHRAAACVVVSRSPTRSKGRGTVMAASVSGEVLPCIIGSICRNPPDQANTDFRSPHIP